MNMIGFTVHQIGGEAEVRFDRPLNCRHSVVPAHPFNPACQRGTCVAV